MEHSLGYIFGKLWLRLRENDVKYSQIAFDEPFSGRPRNQALRDEKFEAWQRQWHRYKHHLEWLWTLSPWFIAAAFGKTQRRLPKKTSTSYLNGVRGLACIIVYMFHAVGLHDTFFFHAYGAEPAENNRYFTQLPIIRVIWAGKGMVAVFFVLSGFVLAHSPLRNITNHSSVSDGMLITGLSSSILRRGIRLFGPTIIMIVLTCLYPDSWVEEDTTVLEHMRRYLNLTIPLLNPYDWDRYFPRSFDQTWTLPAEYRGSMMVFLMCIATARLTTVARKVVIVSTAFWALYHMRGDMYCFLMGMAIAELRFNPLTDDFAFMRAKRVSRSLRCTLAVTLFLVSIFVLSWPEDGDGGVEPYKTMNGFVPEKWRGGNEAFALFWGYFAAPGLLFALENLPSAQRLLSTTPMLYFGEISFSFYLLHWSAFQWPGRHLKDFLERDLEWSRDSSIYTMLVVTFILLVTLADVFWRTADEGCVKLSRTFVDWLGIHDTRKSCAVGTSTVGLHN
ncbi:hypothetical protein PFICI_02812 [Pestalotiopsis fici W106-1]|uniref:Acyltransferase 3 domain-containing protein n=1 Tax=Pestalotiopsis fici (strain W106-1 / CGMCC3.15140) TaxID=1229662 RepID=W3XH94_PESFW|nr:uncharacterized protein PFICI_02812 [Pestalotiopsis fici W106-1]ETS84787.1 hypothetical protein PFICI_02812 [Pestalotiopsis fici W106-1]